MLGKYLGLDLSLSSTGAAIIEVKNKKPKLITAFRVKTNPKDPHGKRLFTIHERLTDFIQKEGPFDVIIREKGFYRFARSTQAIFKVVGVVDMILKDHQIVELSPTAIKKELTGNDKASKEEVEQAVRKLLRLRKGYKFESDDASDAAAVILTYLIQNRIIGKGK